MSHQPHMSNLNELAVGDTLTVNVSGQLNHLRVTEVKTEGQFTTLSVEPANPDDPNAVYWPAKAAVES